MPGRRTGIFDEDRRPGIDARHQSLPRDGRDPSAGPDFAGGNIRFHRIERDDRLGDHRGPARRSIDHSDSGRGGARCGTRPPAGDAETESRRGLRRRREAGARSDHRRCDQFLRRRAAEPQFADSNRSAIGACHRRPGRGRGAPLRQRRRTLDGRNRRHLRRASRRRRTRRRHLPAEPDFRRTRRELRRGPDEAPRRRGFDRQRRQFRHIGRALVRPGA